ncbi:MAG TPA: hypothetical protein VGG56_11990 [Terracidiphilus sp.]|jgi:20S proteasome alpha/beta subunit
MTICVAAMAAKRKAIVMVADKAITFGKERPMQADLGIDKMLSIGKTGWQAMVAGDASFAQEVVDAAVAEITNEGKPQNAGIPHSLTAMMRCMKDACKKVRRQWVIDRFIAPRLFNETDPFAGLPDEYVIELSGSIAQYQINCSLLVCGFDSDKKPHIFSVLSPGLAISHDIPGFHAVGIGRDIALGQLYQYETKDSQRLDETMYELFDAKATAELIQGVGYLWDCSVLIPDLPEPVKMTTKVRDALEGILREATCSPYVPSFGSQFDKIPEWKETVRIFADDLLGIPHQPIKPAKRRPKSTPQKSKSRP